MPYRLWVRDEAKAELKELPGNVRQRVRQAIQDLRTTPRPHNSGRLHTEPEIELEARRVRLDRWRILYVIDQDWSEIGVLAIRKRPPYDYADLADLLHEIGA
jgi:mRNA interferase RelE/StbE